MIFRKRQEIQPLLLTVLAALALGSATLPWFRNHDYLRDFMDYGLVMSAIGRINAGEHVYTDFVTPIQAGYLHLNHAIETLGGGTYLALTYGGLALVVVGSITLTLMARRWLPWWAAIIVVWSIVVCTASQHTILWYNPLGTLCLAGALWAAAATPTFAFRDWPWLLLLGGCLVLGGLTKINYQFIAIVGVTGFWVRAAVLRRLSIRRLGAAIGFTVIAAIVLPITIEMHLTGTSFAAWRYNVLELASGGRAAYLLSLVTTKFYLRPLHDYYGPLLIPQIGGMIVALLTGLLVIGIRPRAKLDRALFVVACAGCMLVALAILATNHEIAYVAFGAALALFVALGTAFDIKPKPILLTLALVLPAALVGGAAWLAAWNGQRSQFGHSQAPRSDYKVLAATLPQFQYIRGLHIPPDIAQSYTTMASILPAPDGTGVRPVYFTNGLEWLDRVWKPIRIRGLPLWLAEGTSCGPREIRLLQDAIAPPAQFEAMFASLPWDHWPAALEGINALFMQVNYCGPEVKVYRPHHQTGPDSDPMFALNMLGINYVPNLLQLGPDTTIYPSENGRLIFGSAKADSWIGFHGVADELRTEMVITRLDSISRGTIGAHFRIVRQTPNGDETVCDEALELPDGMNQISRMVTIDGHRFPLRFYAHLPGNEIGSGTAGWFAPAMLSAIADSQPPPQLYPAAPAAMADNPGLRSALVHCPWEPDQISTRGTVQATEDGLLLAPGGQVWLRADIGLSSLDGIAKLHPGDSGMPPMLRVLWYKGGRIQLTDQIQLSATEPEQPFHSWSSAAEGWFGMMVDPAPSGSGMILNIRSITR